jgi:DsbC/DsbD-like thiol-disulfide interchange protein
MAHYVMRLLRHLLLTTLLLACLASFARASDPLPEPTTGKSNTVTQPHVTAELITETTTVQPGKPFDVALHLHMDKAWHTYWINPGDAGLATSIQWTLPPGLAAGPIQWPTPEIHAMGPLTTYSYGGDVYLLTTITPTSAMAELPGKLNIGARASWLVCQEECIPGKADLKVTLALGFPGIASPQPERTLAGMSQRLISTSGSPTLWSSILRRRALPPRSAISFSSPNKATFSRQKTR